MIPWEVRPLCNHPCSWKGYEVLSLAIDTSELNKQASFSPSHEVLSELLKPPEMTSSGKFQDLGG